MRTRKTAVITGAGSGMGRAIAHRFAADGAHCHLIGRDQSKLESVAAEIAALGGHASVHAFDLLDDAAIARFGEALAGTTVDMLINCAGDWLIRAIDDTGNDQLDHILDTNLRAPYILSRTLLPHLRRSHNASIINIGSLVTALSVPGVSAYTASKVGLGGLSRALAAELREDGIRVVMLSPGPADTPMRAAASPGIDKAMLVPPGTVADMVMTLASLPRGITTSDFVLSSMRWG